MPAADDGALVEDLRSALSAAEKTARELRSVGKRDAVAWLVEQVRLLRQDVDDGVDCSLVAGRVRAHTRHARMR